MAWSDILLSSASRTAAPTSTARKNFDGRGIRLCLDITSVAGGGSVTGIEIHGSQDGSTYTKLHEWTSLTLTTTGQRYFLLYPAGTMATGGHAAAPIIGVLPTDFKVKVTHANSNAIVYSLSAEVLP